MRLEAAFWDALRQAASAEGVTVGDVVQRIDETRSGPLTSAVRVWLLRWALTQR